MTQPDLFEPVKVPKAGTQHHKLLLAFQRGERLTVGSALARYGVYALSQRVGELKRMGWPVESRTMKVSDRTSVSEYWLA